MKWVPTGCWALLLLLCVGRAEIAPTPGTQDIDALFNAADLVCNCSIQATFPIDVSTKREEAGSVSHRHRVANVYVNEFYKSPDTSTHRFTLDFEDDQVTKGENAILFIKSTEGSTYALTEPFASATPFLVLPKSSGGTGLRKLESVLSEIAGGPSINDKANALRLLQGLSTLQESTISVVNALTTSSNPEIALSSFAVLMRAPKIEGLENLRNYLRNYHENMEPVALLSIGSELGRVSNNGALVYLIDLSNSRFLPIRTGSIQALRTLRSTKAAAALIRRLDDANGYIRYLAVISLAETFEKNGEYAPNMDLFDRNPAFYIGLWKTWWTTDGQEFHPVSPS